MSVTYSTTECLKPPSVSIFLGDHHHLLQHAMSQQLRKDKAKQEGRIELALQAYKDGQFQSLRRAANAYNVCQRALTRRYNGTLTRANTRPSGQKLSATEEQTIIRYILNLDSRG